MRPFRSGISTYHLMMVYVQALNTVGHAVCFKLLQSASQSKYTTQTTSPTSRYVQSTSRMSVHKPGQLTSISRALQDSEGSITPALSLKRTSTGIISNRRPTTGTPALSGTTTPSESQASGSATPGPRLSIMAAAKQQAARRMLYSMFYRGPVLTNEEESGSEEPASVAGLSPSKSASPPPHTRKTVRSKDNKSMSKKRRAEREDEEEDKQERKRRKREAKEKDGKSLPKSKGKGKEMEMEMVAVVGTQASDERDDGDDEALEDSKASKAARKAEKAERKRRKAEKLARKEERRKRKLEEERRQRKLERKAAKIKGVESKTDADEGDSGSQDTTPIDRSAATGTSSASPRHTKVKKKGKKS